MNLQQYLMEHGILKNEDAAKMAQEITEMFGDRATKAEAACRDRGIACFKCGDGYTPLYCLNCAEDKHAKRIAYLEAACAEMRMVLIHCYSWISCPQCGDSFCDMCKDQITRMDHALSTDCGKGVMERVSKLREVVHAFLAWEKTGCGVLADIVTKAKQALEETK